jgi:hypothetical protein
VAEYHTTSGKLADPAFRAERARKAAQASHSLDAHIRALVNAAPPLTPAQREKLTQLLHPGDGNAAAT